MALNSMWEKLDDACQEPDRAGSRLWGWLKEKIDLALYRPRAAAGVETSALTGRAGPYYVLKNPEQGTYFQISDRDYFLWEQMDGTRSVKDLVVAYFLEYGAFAFGRIARLVYGLKSNYMLEERPLKIYNQINLQLLRRSIGYRLQQFGSAFMSKPFAIRGVDGVVSWLYRILGWLF